MESNNLKNDLEKIAAAWKAKEIAEELEARELFSKHGETYFTTLTNDLKSTDRKVRNHAINALGAIKDKRAVPHLSELVKIVLNETDVEPTDIGNSRLAIKALGKIKDPETIPLLTKVYIDLHNDAHFRRSIDEVLVNIGNSSIPFLLQCLIKYPYIRRTASIFARLGKLGEEELIRAYSSLTDEENKREILLGIGDSKNETLIPFLQNILLEETKDEIRSSVIYGLEKIQTPSALETLHNLLESENIKDRDGAARALGWIKDKTAVPKLLRMLDNEKNSNNSYAISTALEMINDRQITPEMVSLLKSPQEWVRGIAARVLGKIGDASHALLLMEIKFDNKNRRIKSDIVRSLGQLQNPVAIPYLINLLDDASIQDETITALSKFGKSADSAIPKIIQIIQDKDSWYRNNAICSLGKIGNADTANFLIDLLTNKDVYEISSPAAAALEDLVQQGEKINLSRIASVILTEKVSDGVRSHCAYILGLSNDSSIVPVLIEALDDKFPKVRHTAIYALELLGDARAVPKLIECLDDEEIPFWDEPGEPIFKTAESALITIGHPDGLKAIEDHKKKKDGYSF